MLECDHDSHLGTKGNKEKCVWFFGFIGYSGSDLPHLSYQVTWFTSLKP